MVLVDAAVVAMTSAARARLPNKAVLAVVPGARDRDFAVAKYDHAGPSGCFQYKDQSNLLGFLSPSLPINQQTDMKTWQMRRGLAPESIMVT